MPPASSVILHRAESAPGGQSDANKFTLNKDVISVLIFFPAPTSLPLQKLSCMVTFLWHSTLTPTTWDANLLWSAGPLNSEGHATFPDPLVCLQQRWQTHGGFRSNEHNNDVFCLCGFLVSPCRLKKKSQSVDIASQGFSPTLVPASPLNRAAPPVAKTTTVLAVQENNTTNSQRRSPRCGELKRGYTIGKWHLGGVGGEGGFGPSVWTETDDLKFTRLYNLDDYQGSKRATANHNLSTWTVSTLLVPKKSGKNSRNLTF